MQPAHSEVVAHLATCPMLPAQLQVDLVRVETGPPVLDKIATKSVAAQVLAEPRMRLEMAATAGQGCAGAQEEAAGRRSVATAAMVAREVTAKSRPSLFFNSGVDHAETRRC